MPYNTIKILIIDDDEDDFFITSELIKNIPSSNFITDWCYKYSDALESIQSRKYDLYFIDYYLGIKTGLDLISEAALNGVPDEPMVLLTGKGSQSIDLESIQAGAMDYLVKSELNIEQLDRCIRYSLERAKSLKALKANERKYRSIFEQSKDCVFIAGTNFILIDINDAACILFNNNRADIIGHPLTGFLKHQDSLLIKEELEKYNTINNMEIDIRSKEGEIKNCILNLSVETDFSGQQYILGVIHDITQRKKAEKATLQAEKLAATGRLIRTLAHEVRNPLNNINLSLEQIHIEPEHESNLYLDIIKRNSKRIGDIISELLNSSRPIDVVLSKTCIQEIMDQSIQTAIDRLTLKTAGLNVKYADEPLYINADSAKLKIAFDNFIINAIEAFKEEDDNKELPLLDIQVYRQNNKNIVQIKDNGIGMSKEHLENLFEPFFTFKRNGMGLGLASSLNILQVHKASVEVASEVNKGTTFIIRFAPIQE